jgi:hypothetical protein
MTQDLNSIICNLLRVVIRKCCPNGGKIICPMIRDQKHVVSEILRHQSY